MVEIGVVVRLWQSEAVVCRELCSIGKMEQPPIVILVET